jgi:protein-disulfide isomerase
MRLIALLATFLLPLVLSPAASTGGGKAIGVPTAPVMIEVFSDYQCPACKTLHEQTLRPLVVEYARTGKVYLVHRDFPLTGHAYARQAALLACAAERVGKYAQVADAMFANQAAWSINGKVEEAAFSVLTPSEAAKVRILVKDPGVAADVERDLQLGAKIPLQQTPTMIITHRLKQYPLTGSVSYPLLRRFIDELLAK